MCFQAAFGPSGCAAGRMRVEDSRPQRTPCPHWLAPGHDVRAAVAGVTPLPGTVSGLLACSRYSEKRNYCQDDDSGWRRKLVGRRWGRGGAAAHFGDGARRLGAPALTARAASP